MRLKLQDPNRLPPKHPVTTKPFPTNTAHLAAPAPATGSAAAQRPTRSDATLGVGRSLLIKKYPLELIDPDFFLSFAGSDVMGAPGDARGGGDMGVDGPELKHLAHGQLILTADLCEG